MPSPKNTHGPVVKSGPTAGNVTDIVLIWKRYDLSEDRAKAGRTVPV